MANDITPTTEGNGVLSAIQDFANIVGNVGQQAAGIYSSFLSAKTTKAIADSQLYTAQAAPQLAMLSAEANKNNAVSLLVYAGGALALLGVAVLAFKKFGK